MLQIHRKQEPEKTSPNWPERKKQTDPLIFYPHHKTFIYLHKNTIKTSFDYYRITIP